MADQLLSLAFDDLELAERTRAAVEVKVAMARWRGKRDKPLTDEQDAFYDRVIADTEARVTAAQARIDRLKR